MSEWFEILTLWHKGLWGLGVGVRVLGFWVGGLQLGLT